MTWLKCCPRCNGDLYENKDPYGRYVACIQCGYYLSEMDEVVLRYSSQTNTREGAEKVPAAAGSAR
ncbi:MAG: hypothetical protein HY672_04360 [Chloroflexi bacterium]|nr:hypothetical protein [Chloroflexota bacterium]